MIRTAIIRNIAIVAAGLGLLGGCSRGKGSSDALAKVNGQEITRAEVDKYYYNQIEQSPQKPTEEQATSLRLSILNELINEQILMQRAEKLKLLATNEEVDSKLNEIRAGASQEEFASRLKQRKVTLDDFKRDLKRNLTVDKVLNKEITSKINISDSDITAYYNAHKAEFNLIEPQYRLARILVTTSPETSAGVRGDKAQNEQQARAKIQKIANLLDSGSDFATLAMQYSEDPQTGQNGGDMGFIAQSGLVQTDPATRDAVAKLKPGQYSDIIPLADARSRKVGAFHIVKLIGKEPAGQRELKDPRVQQSIRDRLRNTREQLLKAAYFSVLRDQAKVQNYFAEEVLKNVGTKN